MKKLYFYLLMMMPLMASVTLTSCESDDQYESDLLVEGDWQGYLGTYYYDRWGLTGTTYETVMRFGSSGYGATSGRGYQVDYDTRSPFYDYAYCTFQWSVVNGQITLIYDDDQWNPVYIYDYRLTSRHFYGYMDDGSRRSIEFDLENVNFGYWDRYTYDYYDYDDDYYYRTRSADGTTEAVPTYKGNSSAAKGKFAEILNEKASK